MNLTKMRKQAAKSTPDRDYQIRTLDEMLDFNVHTDPWIKQFMRHMEIKHGKWGSIHIEIVDLVEYGQKKIVLEYKAGGPPRVLNTTATEYMASMGF